MAVNVLVPYILTALIDRPARLIYVSSGMHLGASADLKEGHDTQSWLAVSNEPAAMVSGSYWHHRRHRTPAPEVTDPDFQVRFTDKLAELTGITLF